MTKQESGKPAGIDRTTLRINPDTYRAIKVFAAETDQTVSGVVERALIEFLDRERGKRKGRAQR